MKPPTADELRSTLRDVEARGEMSADCGLRFQICLDGARFYGGLAPGGKPALLIPLAEPARESGRLTGGVSAYPLQDVLFEIGDRSWRSPAAVVECTDTDLGDTWFVLAADVARSIVALEEEPRWGDVLRIFATWERLLRARRTLSHEEELGLWGELWLILAARSTREAVEGWTGPAERPVDFLLGGVGLECKATTRRLNHHVSVKQADRPVGDRPAYVVSLWVAADPAQGETLPQLVDRIAERLDDVTTFEQKLMDAGYSRADEAAYGNPYLLLERPLVFGVEAVPRVREVDRGVIELRYTARLREEDALDARAATAAVWKPTGIRAWEEA